MPIDFVKMHGLGNDFIIITPPNETARAAITAHAGRLADRRWGIGCDQILLIDETGGGSDADIGLAIINRDGSVAEACGNGMRCVADLVMRRRGVKTLTIATSIGVLRAWREGGQVAVTMGVPKFDWQSIPLASPPASDHADHAPVQVLPSLPGALVLNLGNPHAVFAVENAEAVDLAEWGRAVETHPLFPQRTNVEFIHRTANNTIRMRVWERGAGITSACGSGAVASAVAAHKLGLTGRQVTVLADGGALQVAWRDDDETILIGPATHAFSGTIDLAAA